MTRAPLEVGRYVLYDVIASGGMAAVHYGRIVGPAGFSRVVAIKRLHPHLASDKKFAAMFLDEARVASRIHHPNVVGVIDVADLEGELFLVMDYVRGESLSVLLRASGTAGEFVPISVVSAVLVGTLYGLHAAHEARDERGNLMHVVHRDVSPQNVLVDVDGVVRVADFGIAKAISRLESTREGELKGKLAYMAPEQLKSGSVDRRTDVYAASVVLWECLTGKRLFKADDAGSIVLAVMDGNIPRPSTHRPEVAPALDALVLRGLSKDPSARFASALEMAETLATAVRPAAPHEVATWVNRLGGAALAERSRLVTELEQQATAPLSDPRGQRQAIVESETAVVDAAALGPASGASPLDAVSATPSPRRPSAPSMRKSAAIVLVAATAAGALAMTLRAGCNQPASLAPTAPAPASPTLEAAPSASGDAAPVAVEPVDADRGAPDASSAPTPRHAPHFVPRTNPRTVPRVAGDATPKKNDCDPPFTIDENGIKRFKRWCPQ